MGCILILLAGGISNELAFAENRKAESTFDADIPRLIGQLSDPDYGVRMGATRRLCALGEPAMASLRAAGTGDDREAALRARKIIQALERVLFAGVEVRLEADRTSIAWDEAIEVRMVLENRSEFRARVPFQTATDQSEDDDAGQVGRMIDASDWLRVQSAVGREVELRIDEISDDPAVLRAVQGRLRDNPVFELVPGERVIIPLTQFNRGWARYPLLDAGQYTVSFRYVPEWSDPLLAQHKVGEVFSNVLTLSIERGAPETVSRGAAQAEVALRRDHDDFVAEIINRKDQAVLINTNYGVSAPFAEIQWVYEHGGRRQVVPAAITPGRSWRDFDPRRFIKVEAGANAELARISMGELARSFAEAGPGIVAGEGALSLSYSNLCDRQWQIREHGNLDQDASAPEVFRSPLPRQLLSTRLTSTSLRLSGAP